MTREKTTFPLERLGYKIIKPKYSSR